LPCSEPDQFELIGGDETEPFNKNHYKADIRRLQAAGSAFASKATHFAWRRKVLPSARSKILIVNTTALGGKVLINSEPPRIDGHILEKAFVNKTDKLRRAVDDAKDQVVAALENVKAQAITTADEIGRATRKTMRSAQAATEEVWNDADKSRFFRRRAKPVTRVTQRSIELACEEFFRSRGMRTATTFHRQSDERTRSRKEGDIGLTPNRTCPE
jgi:hypothetical protein